MKQLLLDLLDTKDPSRTTTNNCMHLITSEDETFDQSDYTHEQLLRRGRDAALQTAQYLEASLQTGRLAHLDHCELLGRLQGEINRIGQDLLKPSHRDYHAGLAMMRDRLRTLVLDHDSTRQARALRRT